MLYTIFIFFYRAQSDRQKDRPITTVLNRASRITNIDFALIVRKQ
jgi:hypothetical protein